MLEGGTPDQVLKLLEEMWTEAECQVSDSARTIHAPALGPSTEAELALAVLRPSRQRQAQVVYGMAENFVWSAEASSSAQQSRTG